MINNATYVGGDRELVPDVVRARGPAVREDGRGRGQGAKARGLAAQRPGRAGSLGRLLSRARFWTKPVECCLSLLLVSIAQPRLSIRLGSIQVLLTKSRRCSGVVYNGSIYQQGSVKVLLINQDIVHGSCTMGVLINRDQSIKALLINRDIRWCSDLGLRVNFCSCGRLLISSDSTSGNRK